MYIQVRMYTALVFSCCKKLCIVANHTLFFCIVIALVLYISFFLFSMPLVIKLIAAYILIASVNNCTLNR